MTRRKYPDALTPKKLAQVLDLDPMLVKTMIYYRDVNGLRDSGALVHIRSKSNRKLQIRMDPFVEWMRMKKLPHYKG